MYKDMRGIVIKRLKSTKKLTLSFKNILDKAFPILEEVPPPKNT